VLLFANDTLSGVKRITASSHPGYHQTGLRYSVGSQEINSGGYSSASIFQRKYLHPTLMRVAVPVHGYYAEVVRHFTPVSPRMTLVTCRSVVRTLTLSEFRWTLFPNRSCRTCARHLFGHLAGLEMSQAPQASCFEGPL
jgi:hypothetical protein